MLPMPRKPCQSIYYILLNHINKKSIKINFLGFYEQTRSIVFYFVIDANIKTLFVQNIRMYAHQNILGDHPLIPQQAFLFIPKRSNDPKIRDDYKIGEGKSIRRLLFQGWAEETYTPYQLQKLQEFDNYLAQKGIKLDSRWDRSWRLRWFLSTGCNLKKCVEDVKIFTEYQEKVRNMVMTPTIDKYLQHGVFYVAGRDSHYRPILVFDVEKIIKLEMSEEDLLATQTYFFQYILNNLLIPGQVENWIVIIDAAHTGLFSLVGSMKKSFTFLSDTYRSRMFVCYVARVPSSISFLWGIVKKFIEEETVRKINFFDEQIIEPLLQFCNPNQLQVKFGGTYPNIPEGQLWPPRQISKEYKQPQEQTRLLSREEYTQYYNKKILYNTKFHVQNIIKTPTKQDTRENLQSHTIRKLQREFKILSSGNVEQYVSAVPMLKIQKTLNYLELRTQVTQKKKQQEKKK